MRKRLQVAAIILGCCVAAPALSVTEASASGTSYFGSSYYMSSVEFDAIDADFDLGALTFQYGMDINEMLGMEFRFGFGLQDDSLLGVNLSLENYYGLYLKPKYRMDAVQLYALFGYASAELELSFQGESMSADDDGFSYGFGLEYFFNDTTAVTVEYMQLINDSDYDSPSFNLGVNYYF